MTDDVRASPAAFWCRVPSRANFGDALTPWLIHRVTGRYPTFSRPDDRRPTLLVTGSIIGYAGPHSTVWGAGIMQADDDISREATIAAVRGPRTRRRALECGANCPEVYGDPALLLPRFHAPPVARSKAIGLAPHFSDRPHLIGRFDLPSWMRLVDMQGPVENVIDGIRSCELVASSSLHGLIVAHAYGVPAVWIEFRPLPSGDRSKFLDYLESIGHIGEEPLRISVTELDSQVLRDHVIEAPAPGDIDLDALWDACPFRPERWPTAT